MDKKIGDSAKIKNGGRNRTSRSVRNVPILDESLRREQELIDRELKLRGSKDPYDKYVN